MYLLVLAGAMCAALGTTLFTPVVMRVARRHGWLARPKDDRWHSQPTALMGGIAIYAGATAGAVAFAGSGELWLIWGGATIMFVTGLVDDLKGIRPMAKLIMQVVAAAVLVYAGYLFGPSWPVWISIPMTFLWLIGITNALNLVDNMDGLAAGIAAIAAAMLALFSFVNGDVVSTVVAAAVAGAAGAFLIYNFKPARIFMGDCGSLFLGYVIGALCIAIQAEAVSPGGFGVYLVSVAVLAIPIFDTTLVTVMRTVSGRAISQGGRDHSSHRLVFVGLSERRTVLTLYMLSLVFGQLALVFLFAEVALFFVVATYMGMGLVIFGIYLGRMDIYQQDIPAGERRFDGVIAFLHLFAGRSWKFVFGGVADLILIVAAFVVAFELRFEQGMAPRHEVFIGRALPIIVALKLTTFYAFGLYKAIWRHAGTLEVVRIVEATSAASLASVVVLGLLYGFETLSKGVFVIDWMILTISATGIRLGYRGLKQYFAARRFRGRKVLLYGAGMAGQLSIRQLRHNDSLGMIPVGFLDDDPHKKGFFVQGLPVLGGLNRLIDSCREKKVDEVIVTTSKMSSERLREVATACRDAKVSCSALQIRFDRVGLNAGRPAEACSDREMAGFASDRASG